MPVFKQKDLKEERDRRCGCRIWKYPIKPENDMLDWILVERTLEEENGEWPMQLHSHPDFEEYWFVLKGKGEVICGDETYQVEPGDLVITPRGVPHKVKGDITLICSTAKHNVYGQTIGPKQQYFAVDKPARDNPELPPIGTYIEEPI